MPECSSGDDIVLLASATAIAISKEVSLDEMNILSSFFNAVGDNLGILAAQQEACKQKSPKDQTDSK